MPLVRVSRRSGSPAAENRLLLDAVHAALVEAFKIPDSDRHQQLLELDAGHFEIPADRGPGYTLVEIAAFPGRSVDAKRALYQALARRFEAAGVPARDLFVVLLEPPLENWSPCDGLSAADRKPGFKLDVQPSMVGGVVPPRGSREISMVVAHALLLINRNPLSDGGYIPYLPG